MTGHETKKPHLGTFSASGVPEDGELVAGFLVMKRPDGTHTVWSGRDFRSGAELPSEDLRNDIGQMIATAFDINSL